MSETAKHIADMQQLAELRAYQKTVIEDGGKRPVRVHILREAEACVTQSRATVHGDAEDNFSNVARLWNAYLKLPVEKQLTALDVAGLMALMKLAGLQHNPAHTDSAIDLVGYAAIMGELGAK